MKQKLLSLIATSTLCLSMSAATDVMYLKFKDGSVIQYNVDEIAEATFGKIEDQTTPDYTIVDISETPLKFEILTDSTVAVIGVDSYNDEKDTLSVPSKVRIDGKDYAVTVIGNDGLLHGGGYSTVIIPSSVKSLGQYAITEGNVKTIVLSEGLTSIGDGAFAYCPELQSVNIPSSVTEIGSEAFYGCSSLTSVEIPSSVTSIGSEAFYGCGSLTAINVSAENPNYSSLDGILYDKEKTVLIAAPGGIKGDIVLPSSLKSIGSYAFYECESLTSVEIPSSVTSIGSGAFAWCESLTSVEIPSSVTEIGSDAFYHCGSLTSVEIPSSVTSIGSGAFAWCKSLTSVEIPSSVTSIGSGAFEYCKELQSVNIPSSVTEIGSYAFYGCSSLTSVEIPSSVTSIGEAAFAWCESLTSVEIPSSVTSIGSFAFEYCKKLDLVIDNSKENVVLGKDAFWGVKSVKWLK